MSNGVPDKLQTGYNLVETSTDNEEEKEFLLTVMSTMGILMEQAMKSAELYTKHANRECILGKDIIIALQFQAHVFFNLPGVKEDCLELKEELRNELLEESDDEYDEEDESEEEGEEESEDEEEWTESVCECGRCKAMNKFHNEWNQWNPTDTFQCSIKNAIDNTISKYG